MQVDEEDVPAGTSSNGGSGNDGESSLNPSSRKRSRKDGGSAPTTTTITTPRSSGISTLGRGVCRIEVIKVEWNHLQPWHRLPQTKSSGTGFCIEGNQILTNAHVVKSAVDIRIRLFGSTRRFPAKRIVYAPEVDLAVLKLDPESVSPAEQHAFFHPKNGSINGEQSSLALEFATDLPALQETVQVVGYPTGGVTICVTEGVVSRIDVLGDSNVAIQVDSAINPGNSGGPALNKQGKVTGVAYRKKTSGGGSGGSSKMIDNIGYLIPAVVVRAFLGRISSSNMTPSNGELPKYTLSANLPYRCHSLENTSLRLAHQVPQDVHGVLVTSVCQDVIADPQDLQVGDVLTHIDHHAIADNGQVTLRGDELIQHAYWIKVKQQQQQQENNAANTTATAVTGNPSVTFQTFRNGQTHTSKPIPLRDIPSILPRWEHIDYQPNYLLLGACIVLPFSYSLRHTNKCGTLLKADGLLWSKKWPHEWGATKELVVLTDLLADELTFSYQRRWRRVTKYNGIPILGLEHLKELWQATCREQEQKEHVSGDQKEEASQSSANNDSKKGFSFVRLELENDDDLVFEVQAAIRAQSKVMRTYEIPKQFQILPPNPNYQ